MHAGLAQYVITFHAYCRDLIIRIVSAYSVLLYKYPHLRNRIL